MSESTIKNPLETREVVQLRDDANTLLYKAEEVAQISSLEQEARAAEFLTQAKRRAKIVDEKRRDYVAPLKAVIDKVNADFKTILEPLEQAEVIVKKGMSAFRSAEDFRLKEEARKEAERTAKAAIVAATETMAPESLEKAQEAVSALHEARAEAPRTVETVSGGQARFRKDWKFEIVDGSLLPPRVSEAVLKLAFEKGLYDQIVRGLMKAGEREIPGVRIWEESTPIILT